MFRAHMAIDCYRPRGYFSLTRALAISLAGRRLINSQRDFTPLKKVAFEKSIEAPNDELVGLAAYPQKLFIRLTIDWSTIKILLNWRL